MVEVQGQRVERGDPIGVVQRAQLDGVAYLAVAEADVGALSARGDRDLGDEATVGGSARAVNRYRPRTAPRRRCHTAAATQPLAQLVAFSGR